MVNRVPAAGLQVRQYFHRYTEDALDLCDVLGSYTPGAKVKLDDVSKILGLSGKPASLGRAKTLLDRVPRTVAVVANKRDREWETALAAHTVQFLRCHPLGQRPATTQSKLMGAYQLLSRA